MSVLSISPDVIPVTPPPACPYVKRVLFIINLLCKTSTIITFIQVTWTNLKSAFHNVHQTKMNARTSALQTTTLAEQDAMLHSSSVRALVLVTPNVLKAALDVAIQFAQPPTIC